MNGRRLQFLSKCLTFAVSLCLSVPAVGSEVWPEWMRTRWSIDQYEGVGPGQGVEGNTLQSSLSLYSVLTPKWGEDLRAKVAARGSIFRRSLESGKSSIVRGEFQESWLGYSRLGLDFKFGRVITPWGRADAVNPTDFLTAKDQTFLSSEDEIRRRGAWGSRLGWVPAEGGAPLEFALAWNAQYPQNRLLVPARALSLPFRLESDPQAPPFFGSSQEWAFRTSFLGQSFDLSTTVFRGRNHFGQWVWSGSEAVLIYEKQTAAGLDFSVTLDEWVLKGESAYFWMEQGSRGRGGASLTQPDHWDNVLGVERGWGNDWRLILQGLYRVHPSLQDPNQWVGSSVNETSIVRGLARANALVLNYQEKSEWGATFLARYKSPSEVWNAEFAVIGNFVGGDFLFKPRFSRKMFEKDWGSGELNAGLDLYGGPREKTLGALRDFRAVFLEWVVDL